MPRSAPASLISAYNHMVSRVPSIRPNRLSAKKSQTNPTAMYKTLWPRTTQKGSRDTTTTTRALRSSASEPPTEGRESEICEDRYQTRSTILTSQLPVARWHEQIGDLTAADCILTEICSPSARNAFAFPSESAFAFAGILTLPDDIHNARHGRDLYTRWNAERSCLARLYGNEKGGVYSWAERGLCRHIRGSVPPAQVPLSCRHACP